MLHYYHISLLCRVQQDIEHLPCHSKTCDRDEDCNEPCQCRCHDKEKLLQKEAERTAGFAPPGSRAILHDSHITWHGDELHFGKIVTEWL